MTVQSLYWAKDIIGNIYHNASKNAREHINELETVRAMFEDEQSRLEYVREITFKILTVATGNDRMSNSMCGGINLAEYEREILETKQQSVYAKFPAKTGAEELALGDSLTSVFKREQYKGGNAVPKKGDVIFDCGACMGETALWFAQFKPMRIFSFETDERNKEVLQHIIKQEKLPCEIVPKVVGLSTGEAWFSSKPNRIGQGKVIMKETDGAVKVPMVSIDDFASEKGIVPNFIKMDIEGSEYDALRGAERVIREHRPRLAIALYHIFDDMWRIPMLLKSFVPEYRFWCRKNHPYTEFDMYAE